MSALDIFAIIIIAIIAISIIAIIWLLGSLPGKIAGQRKHPQTEAITVGGWVTLLFPILWPLILIWAYIKPNHITTQPIIINITEQDLIRSIPPHRSSAYRKNESKLV